MQLGDGLAHQDARTGTSPPEALAPSLTPAVVTTPGPPRDQPGPRLCVCGRWSVGSRPSSWPWPTASAACPEASRRPTWRSQVVSRYAHYVIPDLRADAVALRDGLSERVRAASRRIWPWARDHGLGGTAGSTLVCAARVGAAATSWPTRATRRLLLT